jgi:hypothetical protein
MFRNLLLSPSSWLMNKMRGKNYASYKEEREVKGRDRDYERANDKNSSLRQVGLYCKISVFFYFLLRTFIVLSEVYCM